MAVIRSRFVIEKPGSSSPTRLGSPSVSPKQLAASTDINLVPWGRIEGVVKIGTRDAPSQRVSARLNGHRFDGVVEHTARTDQHGRFKIEYVTPGVVTVSRQVLDADGVGQTLSNSVDVEVAPGQTAHVEIGGTGRQVIGRFALRGGAAMTGLASGHARLRNSAACAADARGLHEVHRRAVVCLVGRLS